MANEGGNRFVLITIASTMSPPHHRTSSKYFLINGTGRCWRCPQWSCSLPGRGGDAETRYPEPRHPGTASRRIPASSGSKARRWGSAKDRLCWTWAGRKDHKARAPDSLRNSEPCAASFAPFIQSCKSTRSNQLNVVIPIRAELN